MAAAIKFHLDSVEWQGLADTLSDGGDWSDYAYIRIIDVESKKINRYTDATLGKKQLKSKTELINIAELLSPSELEKFYEEEGHCMYHFCSQSKALKIMRQIFAQNSVVRTVYFYTVKTTPLAGLVTSSRLL